MRSYRSLLQNRYGLEDSPSRRMLIFTRSRHARANQRNVGALVAHEASILLDSFELLIFVLIFFGRSHKRLNSIVSCVCLVYKLDLA